MSASTCTVVLAPVPTAAAAAFARARDASSTSAFNVTTAPRDASNAALRTSPARPRVSISALILIRADDCAAFVATAAARFASATMPRVSISVLIFARTFARAISALTRACNPFETPRVSA